MLCQHVHIQLSWFANRECLDSICCLVRGWFMDRLSCLFARKLSLIRSSTKRKRNMIVMHTLHLFPIFSCNVWLQESVGCNHPLGDDLAQDTFPLPCTKLACALQWSRWINVSKVKHKTNKNTRGENKILVLVPINDCLGFFVLF